MRPAGEVGAKRDRGALAGNLKCSDWKIAFR